MERELMEVMEEAAREGAESVLDVLKRRSVEQSDLALANIGTRAMAVYSRMCQARSSRDATMVTIMTHAAENREEFKRLVLGALPGTPVAKALNEGQRTKSS